MAETEVVHPGSNPVGRPQEAPSDTVRALAWVIFCATFHPDDVVNGNARAKWSEWPQDREAAIGVARVILSAFPIVEWLPIKDAPRDGRPILLAFGSDGVGEGYFVDDDSDAYAWKFLDRGCVGGHGPYGVLLNGARDDKYGPTHFALLPAISRPAAPSDGAERATPGNSGMNPSTLQAREVRDV